MKNRRPCPPEDILIQWRDLFYAVLRHWRSLLAAALVLALVLAGGQFLLDYRSYQTALKSEKPVSILKDAQSLAKATVAIRYAREYEQAAQYLREAPLMKIDAKATPTRTLTYYISGARSRAAAGLYRERLVDEEPYLSLAESFGKTATATQVMELVSVSLAPDDAGLTEDMDYMLLTLRIVAPSQELCETMANRLKAYMSDVATGVNGIVGVHSCRLAGDSFARVSNESVRSFQQGVLSSYQSLGTTVKSTRDALNSEERAYYDRELQATGEDEEAQELTAPSVSKKMLVLGAFGGFAVLAVLYVVQFLFDRRVKSAADLEERFSLPVLGAWASENAAAKGWLYRRFYPKTADPSADKNVDLLCCQIQQLAEAVDVPGAGDGCLYLTGTAVDEAAVADLKTLAGALKTRFGLEARWGISPLKSAEALKAFEEAGCVILLETAGVSCYEDLYRMYELCDRLPHAVLAGAVLVV